VRVFIGDFPDHRKLFLPGLGLSFQEPEEIPENLLLFGDAYAVVGVHVVGSGNEYSVSASAQDKKYTPTQKKPPKAEK
jgi:hypothetical protein